MHTLPSLRRLYMHDCNKLQSLPRGLGIHADEPSGSASSSTHSDMTSSLENLTIYGCNSLLVSSFNESRFLSVTLKKLEIRECRGVKLLAEINVDHLQSLQEILIWDCANLRSLPHDLHMLSQLTSLELFKCPALELDCFPPLPPSISKFSLWSCPKIKSLPDELHQLTCLSHLEIRWCESITRFPDGKLPSQLRTLALSGCGNIRQPVGQWLTRLTSLEWLYICGTVGGAGEEEDLVLPLPTSLLDLRIFEMGKVKRLSGNLPPSLRKLLIHNCPDLRELPQDGLPPSLEHLWIKGCGILEKRCREPTGLYWPLIREIPWVAVASDEELAEE
ncbi:hypothetical protein BT93_B1473 [Corymbia citriodora subsp. variegata]|nr:hypothetical protein BT93_B1473 [Corymbia citriodora subsp. variegata]